MNQEFFDLALEGTTLDSLFQADKNIKTVVLDTSGNYGTTYSSLLNLKNSPYIQDLKIIKDKRKNDEKILIEAIPMLLGSKDKHVLQFGINAFGEQLDFVDISEIYYISDTQIKFPLNKNEIATTDLSNHDAFYYYKAFKDKNLKIIGENFNDKKHPLYKALITEKIFNEKDFNKICENFGNSPFIYPLYGLSEISESAAMKNSFNGVVYVLNTNLRHEIFNNEVYKHVFKCDLGTIYAKEYQPKTFKSKIQNIKVILTRKKKYGGNFLAFLNKNPEFSEDDHYNRMTKVIGLYSDTEVCPLGYQLLYFINESHEITQSDLLDMTIFESDIILELSFQSKYVIDL